MDSALRSRGEAERRGMSVADEPQSGGEHSGGNAGALGNREKASPAGSWEQRAEGRRWNRRHCQLPCHESLVSQHGGWQGAESSGTGRRRGGSRASQGRSIRGRGPPDPKKNQRWQVTQRWQDESVTLTASQSPYSGIFSHKVEE